MKILFVWPNNGSFGCKPIGISLLSAILKRDWHEVDLFDTSFIDLGGSNYNEDLTANGFFKTVDWGCDVAKKKISLQDAFEAKVKSFKPDLIAISLLADEIKTASLIGYTAKNMEIPVVFGNKGVNTMNLPGAIFCGEAIETFPKYVNAGKFKSESRFCYYPEGYYKSLDKLPCLDWSLFDDRHFLKAYDGKVYRGGDHMIGWGCINSCSYCINEYWRNLHGGMKGCIRMYSVERVIDELMFLSAFYKLGFFKFHDEDFLLKPISYLHELSKEYAKNVHLPFTCMANPRSVTPEKAELLANMGCVSVSIGIESGNTIIRQILRRKETISDIIKAVKYLEKEGIRVSSFNMIGLPFETSGSIECTIEWNRIAQIKHPNVSFYMPLRGTKLHDISVMYGFYNSCNEQELRTDRPNLKLPKIDEEQLMYYYKNFYNLVTKEIK